jgi:hypothetical protein
MPSKHDYWFPAKRYGWGWGFPARWQGWVAMIVYFLLLGVVIIHFQPARHPLAFAMSVALLTLVLLAVCWLKGEPPRWRWGDD